MKHTNMSALQSLPSFQNKNIDAAKKSCRYGLQIRYSFYYSA